MRSDTGSWFKIAHRVVDTEAIRFLPYRYDALSEHLEDVRADAERLLERVQHWLGRPMVPASLVDHYADNAFEGMHGIEEVPGRDGDFWIVTGRATHFLLAAPEEVVCPFHDFGRAREQQWQALGTPLINPSIKGPRAFFTNGKLITVVMKTYPGPSRC